jgi:acetyl-CoA C-acetyltransferase
MQSVYIASAVRTAIGKFGGALKDATAADLGATVVKDVLDRSGIEVEAVDEVIVGHARQAGNGPNVARQISYRAGIPEAVPAFTVNQACASGLKALMLAATEIRSGNAQIVVAAGAEAMSRVPYFMDNRWGYRLGNQQLIDGMYKDGFMCPLSQMLMGETAEILASTYGISRERQDEYAFESQHRALCAIAAGKFKQEIAPIELSSKGNSRRFDSDEHVRDDVSLDQIRSLRPVFSQTGTVTAGNSCGITDGAAAVVLISEKEAAKRSITPLSRVVDYSIAGVSPKMMGIAPASAVRKLIANTNLKLTDFDLIELNEAFAAQVLACLVELPIDRERLNVNGGAIALGHPIGCTGIRIVTTLIHEMRRRDVRYGLATLCASGGIGAALAVETV